MRSGLSALAIALPLLAGGCAAPVGDFGRPVPNIINDTLLPLTGDTAALIRGEPVSFGPLTDEERRLRDLAYAILMPPDNRQVWERTLAEWRRTRIFPEERTPANPANYSDTLLGSAYRSSTARYSRLMDDIRADSTRLGPFFNTAVRVAEMDGVRARALTNMMHISAGERESAMARIAENEMIIGWVQRRFMERYAGYQLALERLLVATPAPAAVEAERTLTVFAQRMAEIQPVVQVAVIGGPPPPPPPGGVVISK